MLGANLKNFGCYGMQVPPLAALLDNSGRIDVVRSNFDRFVLELCSEGLKAGFDC